MVWVRSSIQNPNAAEPAATLPSYLFWGFEIQYPLGRWSESSGRSWDSMGRGSWFDAKLPLK